MIYLRLFLNFLMIGALSFGGGYGMVSLVRERVLSNGWLTENEFLNFIAVSESTPGTPCREYGNLYRLNTGRNPRFICCNAGRGVAVIFDYSLNCIRTKESDEICTRQRLFIGSSSVRCSDDPCDRAQHGAVYAVWPHRFTGRICADLRSIAVFAMLGATHLICKIIRKTAPSPILMILFSAGLGILFW